VVKAADDPADGGRHRLHDRRDGVVRGGRDVLDDMRRRG
jgi:hypothetical protein